MICEKNEKYSEHETSCYACDGTSALDTGYEVMSDTELIDLGAGTYPEDEYDETADEYVEYDDDMAPDTVIEDDADTGEEYEGGYGYGKYNSQVEETPLQYALDGVIYEVAEELYFREKEAMERSAEEPPFHRVFDEQSMERLDEEYYARRYGKKRRRRGKNGELTTAGAFLLELLLMIPVINVITAAVLSFREQKTGSIKACARAYTIWSALITAAAASCAVFFIAAAKLSFLQ